MTYVCLIKYANPLSWNAYKARGAVDARGGRHTRAEGPAESVACRFRAAAMLRSGAATWRLAERGRGPRDLGVGVLGSKRGGVLWTRIRSVRRCGGRGACGDMAGLCAGTA